MNQNVPELLSQGLIIFVLGMGLLFAGLSVLWGLIALLSRLFRPGPEDAEDEEATTVTPPVATALVAAVATAEALTAERSRVAAIVAGALMGNALSLGMEAPAGPAFEHGRTAPSWVSTNRARTLQSWQAPRFNERVAAPQD